MNAAPADFRKLGKRALACALVFGIWFAPIPAGLTREAWHLFAVFAAAIFAVIVNAFPLLTASLLAVGRSRADRHRGPGQGLRRFRELERAAGRGRLPGGQCGGEVRTRTSHQSARGERIRTVHARTGLQHLSHRRPDRAGVSEQYGARRRALPDHSFTRPERGSRPEDADGRRLGGYLMFCGMASLSVSSALWLTATSANPIGVSLARKPA